MADKEDEKREEKREDKGKPEEKDDKLPGHSKKESKLLWWGLGIGAAGLVATLLLFKGSGSQGGQTAVNAPAAMVPNPQNPFDASTNDYWPTAPQTPSPVPAPGGGTTTPPDNDGPGKKKKKKKTSGGSSSGSGTVSPHHTKTGGNTYPGTSIPKEPTVPLVNFGGAHGWVYTTKAGDTLLSLQQKFWPGANQTNTNFIRGYANNKQLLKGNTIGAFGIKPGTKIVA